MCEGKKGGAGRVGLQLAPEKAKEGEVHLVKVELTPGGEMDTDMVVEDHGSRSSRGRRGQRSVPLR